MHSATPRTPRVATPPGYVSPRKSAAAGQRLYELFGLFQSWADIALGDRPPPGYTQRAAPASEEYENSWCVHGPLLRALTTFARSRASANERLRSVSRWHQLYITGAQGATPWPWQVECLAGGRRGWREWRFYSSVGREALLEGAAEFVRALLRHGWREWRQTLAALATADEESAVRAAQASAAAASAEARALWAETLADARCGTTLCRRSFDAWSRLVAIAQLSEATAL